MADGVLGSGPLNSKQAKKESDMKQQIKVWDIGVRVFHWALVAGVTYELLASEASPWHIWVGYAIMALVAWRLLWGLIGTRYARFSAFPPSIHGAVEHLEEIREGKPTPALSHNPLGALMVYNLLATLVMVVLTGYMMTTIRFYGDAWVGDLHEMLVNWLIFSVLLHVAGVVFESRRSHENLVKSMVTGYKARQGHPKA